MRMKEKNLLFKRAMLALCLLAVCWLPAKADVMHGDVDGDGAVEISDVTWLIEYLLTNDATGVNLQNADVNQDGQVDIADVSKLIDLLLLVPANPHPDSDYVDLGLPSGTLWATCNVGASAPEEYGDYFSWGETEPKVVYNDETYKWCNGFWNRMTKYCTVSDYGYDGFVDNKTELDPEDDAAYVNWGPSWRMPTSEQQQELIDNCTWTWTMLNGVNGQLVTGPNGKSIFLPAAGCHIDESFSNAGSDGCYWSRMLSSDYPFGAYSLYFTGSNYWNRWLYARKNGLTVRAVRVSEENHEYVDLGLSSGTLWATCNVGASAPEEYGDYFAWGETEPKDVYKWETYQWCTGSENTLIKYCMNSNYGYNGFTDGKTELDPEDDAAYVNWGSSWRMPTKEQYQELCEQCTWTWTTQNGVNGQLVTGPNGNTIFLPAAGLRWNVSLFEAGSKGGFWSSTVDNPPRNANGLFYNSGDWYYWGNSSRDFGWSVRAVRVS